MRYFSLVAFLALSCPSYAKTVAFLGDSISTGGGAHPYLALDLERFQNILSDKELIAPSQNYPDKMLQLGFTHDGQDKPQRLPLSRREFSPSLSWLAENLWLSFGSRYLDAEEYSWSYLLSKKMGVSGDHILIGARDGDRIANLSRQVDRLLDASDGIIPEEVYIFFTGNDLCGLSIETVTSSEDFKSHLEKGLSYLLRNGKASEQGSNIYILSPLGSLQIVTNIEIAQKEILFHGKMTTCKNLQSKTAPTMAMVASEKEPTNTENYVIELLFNTLANSPANYCSTLFSVVDGNSEMRLALSNRIVGYRKAIGEVVKTYNEKLGSSVRFNHLKSTEEVIFEANDIANDCFHLSLDGQAKIAQSIYKELKDEPSTPQNINKL